MKKFVNKNEKTSIICELYIFANNLLKYFEIVLFKKKTIAAVSVATTFTKIFKKASFCYEGKFFRVGWKIPKATVAR